MMIANIRCKPLHDWIHFHVAGRSQRRIVIRPVLIFTEFSAWEIMLAVENVGAHSKSKEEWKPPD